MASTLDVGAALPNPSGLTNSEDDLSINVQSILCDSVQDDQDDSYYIHEFSYNLPHDHVAEHVPGNIYTAPDDVEPEILACATHLGDPPTLVPWTTKVTLNDINFTALIDTGASADLMRPDVADKLKLPRHQCATLRTLSLADKSTHKCNQYVLVDFNLSEVDIDSQPRKFFVADMPAGKHEIILGMPFVKDYRLTPEWQDDMPWPLLNVHVNGNASTIWTSQYADFKKQNDIVMISSAEYDDLMQHPEDCAAFGCIFFSPLEKDNIDIVNITSFKGDMFTDKVSQDHLDTLRQQLTDDFKDVFPTELPNQLPPARAIEHEIRLPPNHEPPCKPHYRLSNDDLDRLKKVLDDRLSKGMISPANSPYGAPVFFVLKKDGSYRMVIDYRGLNKLTVRNKHPLPRTDEMIDRLHGVQYVSKIDLRQAYEQVLLKEEDRHKAAFRTRYGSFQPNVMTFGLSEAPATFTSLMTHIFRPHLDDFILVYLDDILVYSKTLDDHIKHLRTTLQILRDNVLYAKLEKCEFFKQDVEFVGYIVGKGGVQMMQDKLATIRDWATPQKFTDIKSFLGFANFYRKYVANFAAIAQPLTALTKHEVSWRWTDVEQNAFDTDEATPY